jgi:peptide/nickel transport system ATP-binding protein
MMMPLFAGDLASHCGVLPRRGLEFLFADFRHAFRSVHTKSHGLAEGEFEVLPNFPSKSSVKHAVDRAAVARDALPPRKATDAQIVLQVHGISKSYSRRHNGEAAISSPVLQDVSFDVAACEVLGIVGGSGSGKSTCAKILLGLLAPDRGDSQ